MLVWNAFISIFAKGGWVLGLIFLQFTLMWYLAVSKFYFFKNDFKKIQQKFTQELQNLKGKAYYEERVSKSYSERKTLIDSKMSLLKLLVTLCPLLGLLGTVTGMISVFDVMAVAGSGNARAMASGISRATIPTMAGMVGALSGLFVLTYLKKQVSEKKQILESIIHKNAQRKG